jgi:hypothetical protein
MFGFRGFPAPAPEIGSPASTPGRGCLLEVFLLIRADQFGSVFLFVGRDFLIAVRDRNWVGKEVFVAAQEV